MRSYVMLLLAVICVESQFLSASQPSSSRAPQEQKHAKGERECCICLSSLPEKCFYDLPCKHGEICIPCVLMLAKSIDQKKCPICSVPMPEDILRRLRGHIFTHSDLLSKKFFNKDQLQEMKDFAGVVDLPLGLSDRQMGLIFVAWTGLAAYLWTKAYPEYYNSWWS